VGEAAPAAIERASKSARDLRIAEISELDLLIDQGKARRHECQHPAEAGQVRLLLSNDTNEEAVITINEQIIKLGARAGRDLTDRPDTGHKSPDSPEIDLPPGKYKVTLKVASGAAQNQEFEAAAGETWGPVTGPAGVPLSVHLY
jgi:hypothetical protein